jgi:hypothetical protein
MNGESQLLDRMEKFPELYDELQACIRSYAAAKPHGKFPDVINYIRKNFVNLSKFSDPLDSNDTADMLGCAIFRTLIKEDKYTLGTAILKGRKVLTYRQK